MLIRIFKSNYLVKILLFSVLSALLWLDAFIKPPQPITESQFLLLYFFTGITPLLSNQLLVIAAFLLVIIQALVLNEIIIETPVFSKYAFLPALVYVILMSYLSGYLTIHPVLFANLFLILTLKNLQRSYGRQEVHKEAFNAGFWIAVASIFHFPSALMILFVWISFLIYRISSWREWLISVIGLTTPYFFLLTGFYLTDGLHELLTSIMNKVYLLADVNVNFETNQALFWALFATILLVSLIRLIMDSGEKLISQRKNLTVINTFFFSSLLLVFVSGSDPVQHLHVIFPSSAIIITYYFIVSKKRFWPEMFFTVLLLAVFVLKFV